jgi:hypothetical protein
MALDFREEVYLDPGAKYCSPLARKRFSARSLGTNMRNAA